MATYEHAPDSSPDRRRVEQLPSRAGAKADVRPQLPRAPLALQRTVGNRVAAQLLRAPDALRSPSAWPRMATVPPSLRAGRATIQRAWIAAEQPFLKWDTAGMGIRWYYNADTKR